ncbi:MAG: hypothetical protein U0105_18430 [Candidatus Obscuribacterales bacterium]
MLNRSRLVLTTLSAVAILTISAGAGAAPEQTKTAKASQQTAAKSGQDQAKSKDAQSAANANFARVSALANQYTNGNQLAAGIAEMSKRLKANPHDVDALLCKALLETRKQDRAAALADMNEAIKQKPNLYYAYLLRSVVQEMSGDMDKAIADATKAYEISHYDDVVRARGGIQYRAKNYKAAIADLSKGLDKYKPDSSQSYLYLYRCHLQLKDWKNATQAAQSLVDINPREAGPYQLLAEAATLSGDRKTAAGAYRRASQLYLNEGNLSSSNEMMKKANTMDQGSK